MAAEVKKSLLFIISNLLRRYINNKIIKNLKNNIDFINLDKSNLSLSPKYKDSIKFKLVENKTNKKKREIIFKGKLSLLVKIFDLKWKIPRQQNNKKFKFMIKFPRIKLNGKKEKTILVSEVELRAKFSLVKVILPIIFYY